MRCSKFVAPMLWVRNPSAMVLAALSAAMRTTCPCAQTLLRIVGQRGLHANHLGAASAQLHGRRHAAGESAAAHRHQHQLHLRHVFQNFQPRRALSGDNLRVVIRRNRPRSRSWRPVPELYRAAPRCRCPRSQSPRQAPQTASIFTLGAVPGITITARAPSNRAE